MSQPGTKPKPINLKMLEGEYRTERLNQNEPKPGDPCLESPIYLIDEAKEIWNRYALPLKNLGIFKQTDEFAYILMCQECGRWIDLQKIISLKRNNLIKEEEYKGYSTKNKKDGDKPIPEMAMARECFKNIKAMMVEFGMTPSSRSRISVSIDKDKDDPIDKILNGG